MFKRIPANVFRYDILPFVDDPKTVIVLQCVDKMHYNLCNTLVQYHMTQVEQMSQNANKEIMDQEIGSLCQPELQRVLQALDSINVPDMVKYKQAIEAQVGFASKGKLFKSNSALEMFLITCKILGNNPETDWTFVEKEMGDPWLPERIRNYPKELL